MAPACSRLGMCQSGMYHPGRPATLFLTIYRSGGVVAHLLAAIRPRPFLEGCNQLNTTANPVIADVELTRADLEHHLAQGARRFERCAFEDDSDLSRLDLQGCTFERCLFGAAVLYACKLAGSSWLRCRAPGADFEAADLVDASFHGCDLNNSKWRRAKLAAATFSGCKLTGASFEEVSYLGLTFEDSLLVGADLRGLSFRKAVLKNLDLSDADLSGCDFREAVFEGGSLRNALLKLARFDQADLRGAEITGIRLNDPKMFRGAVISHGQAASFLRELDLIVI